MNARDSLNIREYVADLLCVWKIRFAHFAPTAWHLDKLKIVQRDMPSSTCDILVFLSCYLIISSDTAKCLQKDVLKFLNNRKNKNVGEIRNFEPRFFIERWDTFREKRVAVQVHDQICEDWVIARYRTVHSINFHICICMRLRFHYWLTCVLAVRVKHLTHWPAKLTHGIKTMHLGERSNSLF